MLLMLSLFALFMRFFVAMRCLRLRASRCAPPWRATLVMLLMLRRYILLSDGLRDYVRYAGAMF